MVSEGRGKGRAEGEEQIPFLDTPMNDYPTHGRTLHTPPPQPHSFKLERELKQTDQPTKEKIKSRRTETNKKKPKLVCSPQCR